NKIGQITTDGVITEFALSTAAANPTGIVAGRDGNLWFTESQANTIGRISTMGVITSFTIPTAATQPIDITVGGDGNLWFTEQASDNVGKIACDSVPPAIVSLSPANGATNVSINPTLVLTFTQPMMTGSGHHLTIKRSLDSALAETIAVDSGSVVVSG